MWVSVGEDSSARFCSLRALAVCSLMCFLEGQNKRHHLSPENSTFAPPSGPEDKENWREIERDIYIYIHTYTYTWMERAK